MTKPKRIGFFKEPRKMDYLVDEYIHLKSKRFVCLDTCAVIHLIHPEKGTFLSFDAWDQCLSKYEKLLKSDIILIFPEQIDRELKDNFDKKKECGFNKIDTRINDTCNNISDIIANRICDHLTKQSSTIFPTYSQLISSLETIKTEMQNIKGGLIARRDAIYQAIKDCGLVILEEEYDLSVKKAWQRVYQNELPNKSGQQMKDSVILETLIEFAKRVNQISGDATKDPSHQGRPPQHEIYFLTLDKDLSDAAKKSAAKKSAAKKSEVKSLGIEVFYPSLDKGGIKGFPDLLLQLGHTP